MTHVPKLPLQTQTLLPYPFCPCSLSGSLLHHKRSHYPFYFPPSLTHSPLRRRLVARRRTPSAPSRSASPHSSNSPTIRPTPVGAAAALSPPTALAARASSTSCPEGDWACVWQAESKERLLAAAKEEERTGERRRERRVDVVAMGETMRGLGRRACCWIRVELELAGPASAREGAVEEAEKGEDEVVGEEARKCGACSSGRGRGESGVQRRRRL